MITLVTSTYAVLTITSQHSHPGGEGDSDVTDTQSVGTFSLGGGVYMYYLYHQFALATEHGVLHTNILCFKVRMVRKRHSFVLPYLFF